MRSKKFWTWRQDNILGAKTTFVGCLPKWWNLGIKGGCFLYCFLWTDIAWSWSLRGACRGHETWRPSTNILGEDHLTPHSSRDGHFDTLHSDPCRHVGFPAIAFFRVEPWQQASVKNHFLKIVVCPRGFFWMLKCQLNKCHWETFQWCDSR